MKKGLSLFLALTVILSMFTCFGISAFATTYTHSNTITPGTPVSVTVSTSGDIHEYYFTPQTTGTYLFYSTGTVDAYGSIYDSSGNILTSNDDGGYEQNFYISYTLTAGVRYTLNAKMYGSKTGSYKFNIVPFNTAYSFSVSAGGSYDIYFSPKESGYYCFYSEGYDDTRAYLYDESGNSVAENDDGGSGTNFKINYYFQSGKTYKLRSKFYNSSTSGTIQVKLINAASGDYDSVLPTVQINKTAYSSPVSSQSITLVMSDTAGIAGYYWGTNSNYLSNTYTSVNATSQSVSKTISSSGSYYLTAIDKTGNSASASISFYTITLNANGGSCSTSSFLVYSGQTAPTLPTPTRTNYTFDGWYTEETGGTKITTSSTFSSAQTLYAHWTVSNYATIGLSTPTNVSITSTNQTKYFTFTAPVTGSYTFYSTGTSDTYGYIYDANNNKLAENDNGGTNNNFSMNYNLTRGNTYILAAKFASSSRTGSFTIQIDSNKTQTVTFNANGGSCSTSTQTVTYGKEYGTLPIPTRTNYRFAGWYTSSSGGTRITATTKENISGNHTLYAQWQVKPKEAEISSPPRKTTYYIGDTISTEGAKLKVTYYDGSVKTITSNLTCECDTSTAGDKVLTLSYTFGNETVSDEMTVKVVTPTVDISWTDSLDVDLPIDSFLQVSENGTISAKTHPEGRNVAWNILSGNSVKRNYDGDSQARIIIQKRGTTVIQAQFTYNNKVYYSNEIEIEVTKFAEKIENIKPKKTKYTLGEKFDPTLTFKVTFSDGTVENVTVTSKDFGDYYLNKGDTSSVGKKKISFNYMGYVGEYNYSVVENAKTLKLSLSQNKFVYSGNQNVPTLTVKDSKGKTLKKGTDYTVSGNTSKKACGVYSTVITGKGNYEGTNSITWSVVPKAVKPTLKLYGHDDIQVTWSKATGAQGYRVYYKKSTDSSWKSKDVTGTSAKLENLTDGVKYQVKVRPYVKSDSGTKYISNADTSTVTIYTLKKIDTPKVAKSSSGKVKVSWNNINGETGYQISQSTSKTETKVVTTFATTDGTSKVISAKAGTTYYYKVRAYKTVDGKKIYGPWSDVKSYKCS